MKLKLFIACCLLFLIFLFLIFAHDRADYHAPIMVMGDHYHKEGDWMVSQRYMTMSMTTLQKRFRYDYCC